MKSDFEITFKPIGIDGTWRAVNVDYSGTLADWLGDHWLTIDPCCVFCRIKRYDGDILYEYWYRAYNDAKVIINIFKTKIK